MRKRERVRLMTKTMKGRSRVNYRDKNGQYNKQHFGLWKYFISGIAGKSGDRLKFYISMDCRRLDSVEASGQERIDYAGAFGMKEKAVQCHRKRDQIVTGYKLNSTKLEDWGLPIGIVESFKKHSSIRELFPWQAECLS